MNLSELEDILFKLGMDGIGKISSTNQNTEFISDDGVELINGSILCEVSVMILSESKPTHTRVKYFTSREEQDGQRLQSGVFVRGSYRADLSNDDLSELFRPYVRQNKIENLLEDVDKTE